MSLFRNDAVRLLTFGVLFPLLPLPALHALSNKDAEKAGAGLFRDKGCAYCHGTTGLGTQKGPSLAKVRKTLKPPQIADQIKNGGKKMPPFDSLSDDEVAQLVRYLRARHRPAPPPVETAPTSPAVSNPAQQTPQ